MAAAHTLSEGKRRQFATGGETVVGSPMPDLPLRVGRLLHAGQKLSDRKTA